MPPEKLKLLEFINGLEKPVVDFWRETLTNLRQLHNDIWNGVRFFLTLNGIVVAGFAALIRGPEHECIHAAMLLFLSVIGILVTIIALSILKKHRGYYLDMLIRKTLIEKQLGFYDFNLNEQNTPQVNLSFPWQVDPKYLDDFTKNITKWLSEQGKRSGLITTRLFLIYYVFLIIHIILGVVVAHLWYIGFFY